MFNSMLRTASKTMILIVAFVAGVMLAPQVKPLMDSITSKFKS